MCASTAQSAKAKVTWEVVSPLVHLGEPSSRSWKAPFRKLSKNGKRSSRHGAHRKQRNGVMVEELEGVVGERDILGAQLIRRNEDWGRLFRDEMC